MKVDQHIIDELNQEQAVTLGFSTEKDSLACALILQELKIKFYPFFFFHIPDLEFVERNLKYYEDKLGMEVIRLPHPMLYDYIRHQDFQTPKMINYMGSYDFPHLSFEDLISYYLTNEGIEPDMYDVVGMRAAESFNRRKVFEKYEIKGINRNNLKIYPIWNWKIDDVKGYIESKNIKLTPDYKIWQRSFDGLKYQFLFGVKKNYPNDWQTIKEYFPLIDIELYRYEQNIKHMGQGKSLEAH
jgi:3'-phosphoadenosine 5'-phosphosulfate sulfotransferase (PAPS reductase)/FAD synthetase